MAEDLYLKCKGVFGTMVGANCAEFSARSGDELSEPGRKCFLNWGVQERGRVNDSDVLFCR